MSSTPARPVSSITMGRQGRIVIPAELRRELGFDEGTRLSVRVVDGELRVMTFRENLRRARADIKAHLDAQGVTGREVMEEFFAERRRDAAREAAEYE